MTSKIRQPELVTDKLFVATCEITAEKNACRPYETRLVTFTEGLCVQCMQKGGFDDELTTFAKNDLQNDLSDTNRHNQIYLPDPRKIDIPMMRIVLEFL